MKKGAIIVLLICMFAVQSVTVNASEGRRVDPVGLTIGVLTLIQTLNGYSSQQSPHVITYPVYQYPQYDTYPQKPCPHQHVYIPNRTFYEVNPPYVEAPMNYYEYSMKLQMCREGNASFCEALARRLLGY